MARYVDGYVLVVPRKNLARYRRMAQQAGKIWKGYGALEYMECVGDDLKVKGVHSYTRLMSAKASDTVFFSFIVYKSRKQRDQVNAKVMKDKRILAMMKKASPTDMKRMVYGGFKALVDL